MTLAVTPKHPKTGRTTDTRSRTGSRAAPQPPSPERGTGTGLRTPATGLSSAALLPERSRILTTTSSILMATLFRNTREPSPGMGMTTPPHGHWDYRDHYGYYEQDYYRGQQGPQDAGQWGPQDPWRTGPSQDRTYKQEPSGSTYSEQQRHDHGRDNLQHHLNDYEDNNPSKDNEELSSYYQGTLESSKHSGLSSSSYELSQYINGADPREAAPQSLLTAGHSDHVLGPQVSAPLKFSLPHVVVSFGPAGQLIRVTPGLSTQKNVSQLEIHSLEVILDETEDQQDMRNFPGPLSREDLHKVDAMEFAQQRAAACLSGGGLQDRSSAALLWNLLILLCRQNGQIVGSDIAELLVQGSNSDGSCKTDTPTLIDFSEGTSPAEAPFLSGDDLLTGGSSSRSSEGCGGALQGYTQLLLAGRKKEALESAMGTGLWGHALFLASKMDSRSYTMVLNRFTGQLTASDPLQTLFHLLTGRVPAAALCCGNEKWGDWRPHLAVLLSNETGDPAVQQKAIVTMGDTLASKGLTHAAHVCYLTAGVSFGAFPQKAERLVLLGSSHRQSFELFATDLAIQCTELYEYCQTLGGKGLSIPSFQVYKFLYAARLLDCGLSSQAFHYCEVVGRALLRQRESYSVLTGEVIKLSDRLRHSEGHFNDTGVSGAGQEPDWLKLLRARHHSLQTGNLDCSETHHPPPEGRATAYTEPYLEDLNRDIQSPEPELLYYGRDPDPDVGQEHLQHQIEAVTEDMKELSWDGSGAQDWQQANSPMPVCAPPASTAAASQAFTYHNTDSAEVTSALPHCALSDQPSAAQAAWSYSAATTMGVQMQEVHFSQQGQQSAPQSSEAYEQNSEAPEQAGWFSGWFKSQPKDAPKQSSTAQTDFPPTFGFCPPPPPAIAPPAMFPSQLGSAPSQGEQASSWDRALSGPRD
ncbi:hypothetical protein CesoFtcFv8_004570 [Champsocephalus esox]|uniref:Protein transport protein sec16 n=1 Tax=Champsocephalus esox TaxID=159716 RepID=A0AAN8CQE2_9TELE|nr:hypothetical protein CesoFtcFv8_004570 [Champsocephalus esox]